MQSNTFSDNNQSKEKNTTFISSEHHSFDVYLAQEYGIEEAILIHHFQYWINHNQRLGRNFKEGRTWTYQTYLEICAHFPYWTPDKLRRYIDSLVKKEVLIKGNFNKSSIDKTLWYAFKNEKMFTTGENAKSSKSTCERVKDAEMPPQEVSADWLIRQSTGELATCIPNNIPTDTKAAAAAAEFSEEESEYRDKLIKNNADIPDSDLKQWICTWGFDYVKKTINRCVKNRGLLKKENKSGYIFTALKENYFDLKSLDKKE